MSLIADRIPVIDADSHVSEPPDLWTARMSKRWVELTPHIVASDLPSGDLWVIGDHVLGPAWGMAPAGWRHSFPSHPRVIEEVDPAAWEPVARASRLDDFGIRAQVLYPNILGAHLRTVMEVGDRDFQLACFRAYNDFLTDFAAAAPGRFVPIMALPLFDVDESVREIERCAEQGHKGILFANGPENAGLPRLREPHWDPVFRAAQDAGLSINFHIGFAVSAPRTARPDDQRGDEQKLWDAFGSGADFSAFVPDSVKLTTMGFLSNAQAIAELILSGLCERYPSLNFVSVESGYGYVPYLIEALDWQWINYDGERLVPDRLRPSEYFRRQIYTTFWFEREVLTRQIDLYPDNVMFETDFPHPTCIAPGPASKSDSARNLIERHLGGLGDDLLRKILYENANRVYRIDES
jgi:predicted TIM-barrel fold metal-dependent hydrolase